MYRFFSWLCGGCRIQQKQFVLAPVEFRQRPRGSWQYKTLALLVILAGGLALTAVPAQAQTISATCKGVTLTGTQAQVTNSMIELGCATVVPDGTYVVKPGNVRSGPGTAYEIKGSKKRLTPVEVDAVSSDGYWCRIVAEGTSWMARFLLAGVPEGLPIDDRLIVANASASPAKPATSPATAPATTRPAAPAATTSTSSGIAGERWIGPGRQLLTQPSTIAVEDGGATILWANGAIVMFTNGKTATCSVAVGKECIVVVMGQAQVPGQDNNTTVTFDAYNAPYASYNFTENRDGVLGVSELTVNSSFKAQVQNGHANNCGGGCATEHLQVYTTEGELIYEGDQ